MVRTFDSNNNNNYDNVSDAITMTKVIARVHLLHLMNVKWALWPPTLRPSQSTCRKLAATIHIYHRHCYYYISWYSFYRPTEGGRLNRPRHCSKGAQPVPKAVYRSGCRDKHNHPRDDSNLSPLTQQSDALTTRLLRLAMFVGKLVSK